MIFECRTSTCSIWICLVVILQLFVTCRTLDSETEAEIDRLVTDVFMSRSNIPGVGLTIVEENGNMVLAKGYGFSNLQDGTPVLNTTKFCVASITKTFTAVLVVKVLSEKFPELGSTVLDTPLKVLIPAGNFTFSDRYRSETMTFRDMLSHRHGLQDAGLGLNSDSYKDLDELSYRIRYAKEAVPFRTYGNYNNAMYAFMGNLIGKLAGSNYYQLLENLFSEIGMIDSTYVKELEDYDSFPNMSKGYYAIDEELLPYNMDLLNRVHVAVPAGGVLTTPADMAKYISFHLNVGKVGDQQVVPEEVMRWLSEPSSILNGVQFKESVTDTIEGQLAVGTGFGIGVYDGWVTHHHSGSWHAFTSRFVFYPAAKIGMFTVVNGPSSIHEAQYNFEYLHKEIFDLIQGAFGTKSAPLPKNAAKFTESKDAANFIPSQCNKIQIDQSTLAGVFGNPVEGEIEISYTPENPNGTLHMKLGKWTSGYLTEYEGLPITYLINWDSDIGQDFYFATGALVNILIDFKDENTLYLIYIEERFEFIRGSTLDTFPEIPWESGSCRDVTT